jgi:hypothetical protein
MPLSPPQIPHDLTWDRTGVIGVGSQRLTAENRLNNFIKIQSHLTNSKLLLHTTNQPINPV